MNNQTAKALTAALQALSPSILSLQNESHMHAGYFEGKESHFKLVIVSDALKNSVWQLAIRQSMPWLSLLTVNGGMVHALAIHAYTPSEWVQLEQTPNSPLCASRR